MNLRSALKVLLASAVIACPSRAYSQLDELGEGVKIEKIQLRGNSSFSSKKLLSLMKTKEPSLFRPFGKSFLRRDFLRADAQVIVSFYKTNGFLDAKVLDQNVTYNEKGDGASVVFDISEGQRFFVGSVSLTGVKTLDEKRISALVNLNPGDPLDLAKIEDIRNDILSVYEDEGYMDAAVGVLWNRRGTDADISFDVKEGEKIFVRDIGVEGNLIVREKHVLREMLVKKGDVLSKAQLLKSQQRIYDTGYFSDVQFLTERKDSLGNQADLLIKVREKKMRWGTAAIGYGSTELINLTAEWGNNSVIGTGMRFVGTSQLAFDLEKILPQPVARLDYGRIDVGGETSWTLGRRVRTRAGVYADQLKRTGVARDTKGFLLSSRYEFTHETMVLLGYDQRWVHAADSSVFKSYLTNSLNLSFVSDRRDDLFDPMTGSNNSISEEFAGGVLGGDNSFQKFTISSSRYMKIFGEKVIAARVKTGIIVPFGKKGSGTAPYQDLIRVPYENRYTLGGATSVRGYKEREIGTEGTAAESQGGLALLLANIELRFPLVWRLRGALFIDSGNVWPVVEDIQWKDFVPVRTKTEVTRSDYRYSVGVGLRFRTPVGPVRLDYGRKLKPVGNDVSRFHVSLGQAF